jgi:hypothetical protein
MWRRVGEAAVLAVLAALLGAIVGSLGVWVADAVTPRATVRGVAAAEYDPVLVPDVTGYGNYAWIKAVASEDGRLIRLHYSSATVPERVGEPAIVQYSRLTRHPVTVRTADGYARLWLDGPLILLAGLDSVLLIIAAVAVLVAARSTSTAEPTEPTEPTEPAEPPGSAVAALIVALLAFAGGAVTVGLLLTRLLSIGDSAVTVALGGTGAEARQYARQVPAGRDVRAGAFSVRVTGPVSSGAPPGATPWLSGFRVLTVPVQVAFYSDDPIGGIQVALSGTGRGEAELVPAAACGGRAVAFDGDWSTADPEPLAGRRICFAVPAEFTPSHLLIGPPDSPQGSHNGAAIRIGTP